MTFGNALLMFCPYFLLQQNLVFPRKLWPSSQSHHHPVSHLCAKLCWATVKPGHGDTGGIFPCSAIVLVGGGSHNCMSLQFLLLHSALPVPLPLLATSHSFSARLGYLKELNSWETLCTFSVLSLALTLAFKLFAVDSTHHNSWKILFFIRNSAELP